MLVDTNVLLRAAQPNHPLHGIAVQAISLLLKQEYPLYVTIQNFAEFWNAATRPAANNGLGFTIEEAREELEKIEGFFELLTENTACFDMWKSLVIAHRICGVTVHDARLAAVMLTYGVTAVLTFDSGFQRFPGIEVVSPGEVGPRLSRPPAPTPSPD